jgi:predicted transcriptional regulator
MSFSAVQEDYAELAGRATAVYGLSPLLGRLWGVLLLSPAPLGLDALAAAVGAAKSTVSVSMRQLERYRLVERHWRRGDRRDYYAARTDYLAILRDWWSQRTWGTNGAPSLGCRSGHENAQHRVLLLSNGPGSSSWLPPGAYSAPIPARSAAPQPACAHG